jgi:hypothetical protein
MPIHSFAEIIIIDPTGIQPVTPGMKTHDQWSGLIAFRLQEISGLHGLIQFG